MGLKANELDYGKAKKRSRREFEDFVEHGKTDRAAREHKDKMINLKLPQSILNRIDHFAGKAHITRTAWIRMTFASVLEELEREERKNERE